MQIIYALTRECFEEEFRRNARGEGAQVLGNSVISSVGLRGHCISSEIYVYVNPRQGRRATMMTFLDDHLIHYNQELTEDDSCRCVSLTSGSGEQYEGQQGGLGASGEPFQLPNERNVFTKLTSPTLCCLSVRFLALHYHRVESWGKPRSQTGLCTVISFQTVLCAE